MSEWPLRYLVAECITMSAPCSSGRCRIGEAKVLSATISRPCFFAMAEMRSEEHTSELQSLMRISYAVFCLKKKNINTKSNSTHKYNTMTDNGNSLIMTM